MKKFLSIVLLALITPTLSIADTITKHPVLGVKRFMIQLRNANAPSLADQLDPGHAKMLALGAPNNIYTPGDAIALDEQAFAYFIEVAGLDFRNTIPDPQTGIRILIDDQGPLAALAPFFIGGDGKYNVLFDSSSDPKNKNNGNWTVRNSSDIVIFLRDGVITTGLAAGQKFSAGDINLPFDGDIISYGFTDQLRVGADPRKSQNRDHFIVSTVKPTSINNMPPFTAPASSLGKQPVNGFVQAENHSALLYCDSNNNPGFGSDNVYNSIVNGLPTLINHHVITFFVNAQTPNPCLSGLTSKEE